MKRWLKRAALGVVVALLLLTVMALASAMGWLGDPHPFVAPEAKRLPKTALAAARARQEAARDPQRAAKQILFGDLHVHSTLSVDAYQMSMPYLQGEGLHPIADACDYARFCSQLDFWSINDHAEGLTPDTWAQTKQAIRDCNAVADPQHPDVLAFLGYEWSQAGTTPENHYGHKNVIFKEEAEAKVPTHPVAAANPDLGPRGFNTPMGLRAVAWLANVPKAQRYWDYNRYIKTLEGTPTCPDVPYAELPADCVPFVPTPAGLFRKLKEWGGESLVIPHGNSWGLYTPPGSTWDKQLVGDMHDPERQVLLEIFSGHGNAEPYRAWREVVFEGGEAKCPPESPGHTPGCRRAGEIIKARCEAAGEQADEKLCEARAEEARRLFAKNGSLNFLTVPASEVSDWQDSEQCRDCALPAFRHRPGVSAQYALALRKEGRRFDFGFIGSSDNHSARPGTGYKEYGRIINTESGAGILPLARAAIMPDLEPLPRARDLPPPGQRNVQKLGGFSLIERQASFFYTGGLVAVHSEGRSRDAVWAALKRKEVYATTGGRSLLWFDLIGNTGNTPMGGRAERITPPRFRARALGAFVQKPGCPEHSVKGLSPERLQALCRGECYHPSDARNPVLRIEVVRVRPQVRAGEAIGPLIEDPWRSFECTSEPCTIEFQDPDFVASGRDALYYVRAVEKAIPMVNADTLRVKRDAAGKVVSVKPCIQQAPTDDCLAPEHPLAWSSPIFVQQGSTLE